ncbi:glutamine amidotransferase [Nostocaceae cyanobacterium CENA357]|uniref:Glutamine amidotransferase n=1 Tax=Atlanticothrix silvestris CENA357 TaxID=1725252 RepID=A0A8J7L413_9CYAN|nr:glutamine amidotransferase [Atlanticothrix silvestris]MBH8551542.1 glutamine amidotransferase [Atlanticothrix silvestris CENA357]
MKTAIIIRHIAFEDLGNLAPALKQHDYAVTYIEAGYDDIMQIDPLVADLVVVLGGPIGVYDESDYPFLSDELNFLESRLNLDLPTLGLCLGGQLIASALGAKVYPGTQGKEVGWAPIDLSEAGKHSPLAHLAPDETSVLHWHGDTFDLPNGSTLLASTSKYPNQAFSWGKHCLALQFHPEVTARGLERWFIGHASEIASTPDVSVNQLRLDTKRYASRLEIQAFKLWNAWLKTLV